MRTYKVLAASAIIALLGAFPAIAAEPQANQPQHMQPGAQMAERGFNAIPSNEIVNQNVDNAQGEKIASVENLIINSNTGKVDYVGLSVSGVSNYVAVPFEDLRITKEANNKAKLTLDITKDRLKQAPTFEKDKTAQFDNAQWRSQVDSFYRQTSAARPIQSR